MNRYFIFFFLYSIAIFSQNTTSSCEMLSKVNNIFQEKHFSPKKVDDSLSVFVFNTFIDQIDENHSLFTKPEYENLAKNKLTIDDAIRNMDCSFFDEIVTTYKSALSRKKRMLERIQNAVLDFNANDTIRYSKKVFDFDLSEDKQEILLNKRIRYAIMEDVAMQSKNLDSLKQHFLEIEKISRKKIFETTTCKIDNILESKNGLYEDLRSILLNIFCLYFDPHSSYFSSDEKSSFISSLSSSNYSIGLDVTLNDNDEIVVGDIIPGSPAYKSAKFDKGDIITKVGTLNGENYAVSCSAIEKIGNLVFSDAYKELILTIRKKNGKILEVNLQKQLMQDIQNTIESFVIEKDIRVGYIKIPSFYSDFEGNSPKGCANDVANEVAKLEKENIQGLIIDLENNGGGSMEETQKLAGMFINSGPISIFVDNHKNQEVLKDFSKGSIYKNPIVVLINGETASASEFFVAAMQDYDRAVVVGTNSFGKATMQTIIPLEDKKEKDYVKITIGKFYRITGKSHQQTGIIPDITLPNLFDEVIQREKKFKTALKNDFLNTNINYTIVAKKTREKAIESSKKRTETEQHFKEINDLNKKIETVMDFSNLVVKMDFEHVFKISHLTDSVYEEIKKVTEREPDYKISNTASKIKTLKTNTYQKEINDFNIKEIKWNPYISEAVNIIRDLNKF